MFLVPLIFLIMEILIVVFFIGSLILQIFLSRMKKPWPGLILPGISFAISLYIVVAVMIDNFSLVMADLDSLFMVFRHINIFTAIYLLIYFLFRFLRRRKQKKSENNQPVL